MSSKALRVAAIVVAVGSIGMRANVALAAATYVDLNRSTNGSGTASNPTNRLPSQIGNGTQLYFNSDNGVQTVPCGVDTLSVSGSNVEIASYGTGRATVSAYQVFANGWTRVGTSNVWQRNFAGANSGAGPVVGNVIDLSSTKESPTGDVLNWYNLEDEGNKVGVFRSKPTVLPTGYYAYDWQQKVMYVNVGANPNNRKLGIACAARFIVTPSGASPSNVNIHDLRIIGFARAGINIGGGSNNWRVHDNIFYGVGGMYDTRMKWYLGSGIQMTERANNLEIDNNTLVQTYDSPITPQHFQGASNGNLHDILIHDNFIDRWALGAVELADWGTNNNTFNRITIEDNTAVNGGRGSSRTGDTPQGVTDGIQVRGGTRTSQFSNLVIRRNYVNGYDSNLYVGDIKFTNAITVQNNTLSGAKYGIRNNNWTGGAWVTATGNTLCKNNVQISDKSSRSQYIGNELLTSPCPAPASASAPTRTGSASSGPTLSVSDVTVFETDSSANFVVTLSNTSALPVTVDVQTADGTATEGDDYVALYDTLAFQPGQTAKTVRVSLLDDALVEGEETFTLNLSDATNADMGRGSGSAAIVDDESTECGAPGYNPQTALGIFVWQDCASGNWQARFTSGTTYTEYVGTVTATQPFDYVRAFSLEGDDEVDFTTNRRVIDFDLGMRAYEDGFDFSYPTDASACFSISTPNNARVYVGPNRVRVNSMPFNLKTLGPC